MILRSKKESTKFQILVEIAAHQPDVRQKEIADKIGITPQAISEYIKELVSDGFLCSDGRVRYRVTKKGVEWVLEQAVELKKYARFVMEDIVSHVSVATAIARERFNKGQMVSLIMDNGLLYAGSGDGDVTGTTISDAKEGEDVGVTDLRGMINLPEVNITICKVPRVERGGSRCVDYEMLRERSQNMPYIAALGVEALISLRKIDIEPDILFGTRESVVEAAFHGLSSLVVSVDEEVPSLLNRLESEGLSYEVVDLSK
ncbi:putative transcriptional regulator [Candidatus Methanoperedens nitroreducens]|uniref:Putative transcriptional regulator n=1 Tax=Candidatus Methanoperedens nitratireducens TaxID=1392998 RepID=A0A062V512_9EURY|nr:winged helix-turn-helix transcriptional regulator [Candidatus Methanoperedens nitroreducens]KCZ70889.1 putative transcriptional regulator [Candidatus Methanoperedens nitroreducens]MDJ1421743.1 winged helix-turn-helix transcriptional regulator [Candidatus Methanoperedens sp.]